MSVSSRKHSQFFGSATAVSFSLAFGLFLIMATSACSTLRTARDRGDESVQTASVLPVAKSRVDQGDGAVVVAIEFKGVDAKKMSDGGCRWRVIRKAGGEARGRVQSTFVNIDSDNGMAFSRLSPGEYQTGRLGCGIAKVWDLSDVFKDGFRVESGQASYLGKLIFQFEKGDLVAVRKAPRAESADVFERAQALGSQEGLSLISGFTGRPLTGEMLDSGTTSENFDVLATGTTLPSGRLQPLLTSLKKCGNEESQTDPLRFGRLEYVAAFKDGRFSEMKSRGENNALSDKLRFCVERSLMAFQPGTKADLEIRVRY